MNKYTANDIERYLRHQMNAEELSAFTLQMVMNPSLRSEVEATKVVFKTLKTTTINTAIADQPSGVNTRGILIAGLLSAVVAAVALWIFKGNDAPVPSNEQLILPKEAPQQVPIAQAYDVIPYFETALQSSSRAFDENNKIQLKTKRSSYHSGETIHFTGQVAPSARSQAPYLLKIWTNQFADFEEERFLLAHELTMPSTGQLQFDLVHPLSKGLYYYTLRLNEDDQVFGKFEIK